MENRINLDNAFVGLRKEHTPITNPEAEPCESPQALDVAGARLRVAVDAGNDTSPRSRVNPPQVAQRPSREHNWWLSQLVHLRGFWWVRCQPCYSSTAANARSIFWLSSVSSSDYGTNVSRFVAWERRFSLTTAGIWWQETCVRTVPWREVMHVLQSVTGSDPGGILRELAVADSR